MNKLKKNIVYILVINFIIDANIFQSVFAVIYFLFRKLLTFNYLLFCGPSNWLKNRYEISLHNILTIYLLYLLYIIYLLYLLYLLYIIYLLYTYYTYST